MLLKEWWAWWYALGALHAQEMLDQRRVLVIADSGWQLDREPELAAWRDAAEGATGWRRLDGQPARQAVDARREVQGLFWWLREKFWGDSRRKSGFEEDPHGRDRT